MTLNGPDGWAKVWSFPTGAAISPRVHCQQRSERLMFLVVIIGEILIEPFRAPEGEKHTSQTYILFLDEHLFLWLSRPCGPLHMTLTKIY